MTANDVTSPRAGLLRRWPITTVFGASSLLALGVLAFSGAEAPALDERGEARATAVAAAAEAEAEPEEAAVEAPGVADEARLSESTRVDAPPVSAEPAAPAPKTKSGLYAMKGEAGAPADAEAIARDAGILGIMSSPYGGAFSVGSDDADVWGGLTGTEVGETVGFGRLGLVGHGRGGGGVGVGYGRGSGAGLGGVGYAGRVGSYDASLQARVLTAGVVDDNADAAGYAKALSRMADARSELGLAEDVWNMAAPTYRHVARPRSLDVAIVIDTTGSMGDELEYLKVELREIAREISETHPGVAQRWGMVAYRDSGDAYVTRVADFTDIGSFVEQLGRQSAGGGGDYPEAMEKGLEASAGLSWRGGDEAARMVFLVADAPSHMGVASKQYTDAVMQHRGAGTAIYPVASSGVRDLAEAQMRLAAKVTGGQYIFLTDHSGVGSAHAKPHVDKYEVETLHDVMQRMIELELGGPGGATIATEPPPPPPPGVAPVEAPELVETVPATEIFVRSVEAPARPGLFAVLRDMIMANPLLPLGVSLAFFMGMALDTFAFHRRRRRERLVSGPEGRA